MEEKEIIKQLEEEKDALELRIIKINGIIRDIKELDDTKKSISKVPKKDPKRTQKVPKKSYTKKAYTKKHIRKGKKWTPEVFEFVKENLELSNDELTKEINKKFGINTTTKSLGVQMAFNKINRKGLRREKKEKNESNLKKKFNRKITPQISKFIESRVGKVGDYRIAAGIEEKFGVEISHSIVKDHRKKNGWPGIGKGRKFGEKHPTVYTKEVTDFMKECADKEMNVREAHEATQKELEKPFSLLSFRQNASKNNIRFRLTKEPRKRFDPKIEKVINDNQHLSSADIRDEVIDKTGQYIKLSEINNFLQKTKKDEGMGKKEIDQKMREMKRGYVTDNEMEDTDDVDFSEDI